MPDWQSIVRTHGPRAFETAWRLLGNVADTEDAVQEAFLDAFQLHAGGRIENWGGLLRQLAARRAIDRLRQRRATERLDGSSTPLGKDDPAERAIERELANRLRLAIAALSEREASVFSLHYFGEMSNAEIGQALGITTGAVGVALHKARARLKHLLAMESIKGERGV